MKNRIVTGMLIMMVFLFVCGSVFAANPAPRTAVPLVVKPLMTEIKANPALLKKVMIPPSVPYEDLKVAMDRVKGAYVSWHYIEGVLAWASKNCAAKSYSIDDQKAAGCLGTDTVDVCTEKLFQHCVQTNNYMNTYKTGLRNMIEAVDNLNRTSNLYGNGLKETEKKVLQP